MGALQEARIASMGEELRKAREGQALAEEQLRELRDESAHRLQTERATHKAEADRLEQQARVTVCNGLNGAPRAAGAGNGV